MGGRVGTCHAAAVPLCALFARPCAEPRSCAGGGRCLRRRDDPAGVGCELAQRCRWRPRLDTPEMLPGHPRRLPHGDRSLQLSLVPFGADAIEMFLRLERPVPPGAPAESDSYETIGQFYSAIATGMRDLCVDIGEGEVFRGDPARQVTAGPFHHSGGRLATVQDLASALAALEEIVEQGEGHPDRDEVAHYYRLQELKLGRRYRRGDNVQSGPTGEAVSVDLGGVHPMRPNPCLDDHAPGSPIRATQEDFNHTYCSADSVGASVQRQPQHARRRNQHHVHAQSQGAEPDGYARRRRHNGRPDIRVRTTSVQVMSRDRQAVIHIRSRQCVNRRGADVVEHQTANADADAVREWGVC